MSRHWASAPSQECPQCRADRQYDIRVNPNDENELFLPDGSAIGDVLLREKLPTPTGTSFPRPRQFHAHGYGKQVQRRSLGVFLRRHM